MARHPNQMQYIIACPSLGLPQLGRPNVPGLPPVLASSLLLMFDARFLSAGIGFDAEKTLRYERLMMQKQCSTKVPSAN
jgi:hypothetical protein